MTITITLKPQEHSKLKRTELESQLQQSLPGATITDDKCDTLTITLSRKAIPEEKTLLAFLKYLKKVSVNFDIAATLAKRQQQPIERFLAKIENVAADVIETLQNVKKTTPPRNLVWTYNF